MGGWPSPFMGPFGTQDESVWLGPVKEHGHVTRERAKCCCPSIHTWHAEPLNPNSFLAKFKSRRMKIWGNSILPSTSIFPYPLVNCHITMENHHVHGLNPLQITIFNSYVWHHQRANFLDFCCPQHWKCHPRPPQAPSLASSMVMLLGFKLKVLVTWCAGSGELSWRKIIPWKSNDSSIIIFRIDWIIVPSTYKFIVPINLQYLLSSLLKVIYPSNSSDNSPWKQSWVIWIWVIEIKSGIIYYGNVLPPGILYYLQGLSVWPALAMFKCRYRVIIRVYIYIIYIDVHNCWN